MRAKCSQFCSMILLTRRMSAFFVVGALTQLGERQAKLTGNLLVRSVEVAEEE